MRKHEGNNATDRGRQRGEHRRNLKDKRHSGAWKLKRHDTKTCYKDRRIYGTKNIIRT